jgi:hypothetical protein
MAAFPDLRITEPGADVSGLIENRQTRGGG